VLQRPDSCRSCALDPHATGFSKPDGPPDAPVAFWGEALGRVEAEVGKPFQGPAGRLLDRLLNRLGRPRSLHRVANIISCQPKNDWLVGAPWERDAIARCEEHRLPILTERKRVHVALGATAAKVLLGYPPKFNVRSFHGCPFETEYGWVVPTFHPSFLLQGGAHFTNVFLFDLKRAFDIAEHGWNSTPPTTIVDPQAEWFGRWLAEIPAGTWVFPDIETPGKVERDQKTEGKDEGEEELTFDEDIQRILRIGFAVHPDEACSVPWEEPYIGMVKRHFLRSDLQTWWWNWRFDVHQLEGNGVVFNSPNWECMDAWGALQSRLPRKVAFVAPFFSTLGPWKHLAGSNLGLYNALDCIQQCRSTFGIVEALKREDRWEPFYRHRHLIDQRALIPSEKIGMGIDRSELRALGVRLDGLIVEYKEKFKTLTAIGKVTMAKKEPKDPTGFYLETVELEVNGCGACSATDITIKHRCKDKKLVPIVAKGKFQVKRWVKRAAFNPGSTLELLQYIESIGEKPGRNKKTRNPSVGKAVVDDIARRTSDPLLKAALEYKSISKVKTTYVDGIEKRLTKDDRVHPSSTHIPWTWRLSMRNPNTQNFKNDDEDDPKPEAGFKKAVVAQPGCLLVEADYSGEEAMLSGYFMNDPDYVRLAGIGMHRYVLSHHVKQPASLSWSDTDLKGYLKEIQKKFPDQYRPVKSAVFARNYVGSAWAIKKAHPAVFKTLAEAEAIVELYDSLTPKRVAWWESLWKLAHRQNYLENPYKYRAYFWEIYEWDSQRQAYKRGPDAAKAVNFKPQSTGYGVLADSVLELWDSESPDYVGDMYYGQTPLRALVHDSILSEVEESKMPEYCARMYRVMTKPVPVLPIPWDLEHNFQIGVGIKVGRNWAEMSEWKS
jgi:DNA polymerase